MKASNVMARDVVAVHVSDTVRDAAKVLLDHRVSGAPVLGVNGRLVGIVSEGDLMRRAEIGTERRRSWWLDLLGSPEDRARDFVRANAVKIADVMTKRVITATEDMSLGEIANLLERNGIKRVPIMRNGEVVGIVSRANLLRAFASTSRAEDTVVASDQTIQARVADQLRVLPRSMPWLINVTVQDGVAELWGLVNSREQQQAIRVAAEATQGVKAVRDHLYRLPLTAE